MDLVKGPTRLELYFTLISPSAPGATASRVQSGVVHPQEALTLLS